MMAEKGKLMCVLMTLFAFLEAVQVRRCLVFELVTEMSGQWSAFS